MSDDRQVNGLSARIFLLPAIALCLGLQAWLAFVTEINWDEYFYLSQIYEHQRGEPADALQKFHVHLLGWLTRVPGDEIDQVVAGRLVMLLCQAASCALIYRLARAFFDPVPSLLAVLAFVSAGFTIMHGASFRADPLATALMMAALAVLARGRGSPLTALLIALPTAVAALVTVKIVFYAPAFAGVAAWRIATAADRRRTLIWLSGTAVASIVALAALYLLHSSSIPQANSAGAQAMMGSAGRTTIVEAGLFPRASETLRAALLAPAMTAAMLLALAVLPWRIAQGGSRRWRDVAVLACAGTLLTLLFYRNAFPYYFPFIWAPASLLVAWTAQHFGWLRSRPLALAITMAVPAVAIALMWAAQRPRTAQQQVLSAVHRIFPEAVPTIDRNSMVASFPKRGFFMSTWGMLGYQDRAPIFERILAAEAVPLLIVNGPALEHAVGLRDRFPRRYALVEADRRLLRDNYIPHWGPVWVAGKQVRVTEREEVALPILIPGTYTLEGQAIRLEGRELRPGETVRLGRGLYRLGVDAPGLVTLRWGDHLHRPVRQPPSQPLYRGF